MKAYLKTEHRNGREWWVFFTWPLCFHVYWMPDGTKTKAEFLSEQADKARDWVAQNGRDPGW